MKSPLSGPTNQWPWAPERERGARGADPGIHHREVHRAGREPVPGPAEQIGAGPDVARGHGVGDVDQHRRRAEAQQDALDLGDVRIGGAEVGQQGDEGHAIR